MKTSDKGIELIERYEGLRLTAYKCVNTEKYYTIGYGHYGADVTAGMQINQTQAEAYLKQDLATAEAAVNKYCTSFTPNQNQYDALVSFAYNCGAGNLKKLVSGRAAATVAEKITEYNKSGGKVLAGLVRRRAEEKALFLEPVGTTQQKAEGSNMGVTISNCGHDENNRYSGGAAGDQTGGEWQLRAWYNKPWDCVLRFEDAATAALIAQMARAAAQNNLVGYDQNQRGTFWQHLAASDYKPENITIKCEADCSSGVAAIVKGAGYRLGNAAMKNVSTAAYTGNLKSVLKAAGAKVLTDRKYLTSDAYIRAGDILLNERHHTTIAVTSGSNAGSGTTQTPAASTFKATGTATCTGNGVRIRTGGGTNYGILTSVNKGAAMQIDGTKQNGWYHVCYNGVVGYMHPSYVKTAATAQQPATGFTIKATCTGNGVRIRKGGGTGYAILTAAYKGDALLLDGTKQNGWYHVKKGNTVGYMHPNYVKQ
ncbi:MAG: hypothetical protein EOM40_10040 [Clostridia bacterium]|nr:hypothetical protein [Clostridia bacterium]